ncbi:MAG: anthranilate phosphoribosyltransferase [Elusimicrobiota bacterium]
MIKEAIQKIVAGNNLDELEAVDVMSEIMGGEATDAQVAAFITALRMKGETIDEITGCARVMRQFATHVNVSPKNAVGLDRDDINIDYETIVDTCGTGGDRTNTFNISTTTAFVVAGAGIIVAKHGNRSVSSHCGSADVLEALGVKLDVTVGVVEKCLATAGIGFLFAPVLHGAMKYAINPRKQIGIRTIFNILGPLTNPANATAQVLGVYEKSLVPILAEVMNRLGAKHVFVVHGKDSLDEVSVTGETFIAELMDNKVKEYTIIPEQFGFTRAALEDIRGGDAKKNAEIISAVLRGEKGPRRDVVLLNSALAIVAAGKASGVKAGVELASVSIDSGAALKKVELLKNLTNEG